MYGYSYGAAKADVWHIAAREAMTYPQYELAGAISAAQHCIVATTTNNWICCVSCLYVKHGVPFSLMYFNPM